jgi:monofunctional biosynthetic peptidoglycan transglycosylase
MRRARLVRRALRFLGIAAAGVVLLSAAWVLVYRVVPVPVSALMLIRAVQGYGLDRDWVPVEAISPHLVRAVIAAEDSKFCRHSGFDWDALRSALDEQIAGGRMLGGSTISMQTAKNAFLWPDRTYLRKAAEAWFTVLIEAAWSKRRIMEVYLNLAEWGPGVYGAEAAARHWFGRPAADLTPRQAALLAAVLPNPLERSPARPSAYVSRRAATIEQRMAIVRRDGLAACVDPQPAR